MNFFWNFELLSVTRTSIIYNYVCPLGLAVILDDTTMYMYYVSPLAVILDGRVMRFNATFNTISAILWLVSHINIGYQISMTRGKVLELKWRYWYTTVKTWLHDLSSWENPYLYAFLFLIFVCWLFLLFIWKMGNNSNGIGPFWHHTKSAKTVWHGLGLRYPNLNPNNNSNPNLTQIVFSFFYRILNKFLTNPHIKWNKCIKTSWI